ncbi:uncharacterized protein [Dendrobates tinctorius]|uniref:uncharacterized protein isoform X1 n=1 Tax=Dendrobates tinctorius TaxID=92724 RepID=UPI003CCA3010
MTPQYLHESNKAAFTHTYNPPSNHARSPHCPRCHYLSHGHAPLLSLLRSGLSTSHSNSGKMARCPHCACVRSHLLTAHAHACALTAHVRVLAAAVCAGRCLCPQVVTCTSHVEVLRLLEVVGWKELLIQLATLPILETVDDLKSQATLRTRTFNYHLDLGQNSQSYDALAHIPERSRAKKYACAGASTRSKEEDVIAWRWEAVDLDLRRPSDRTAPGGLCPPCLLWFGCRIPPSITFCKRWKRIKVGYTKSCGRSSIANLTTTFRTWETPRHICSCAGEASAALCFMVFPFIPVCSHFLYNKI